MVLPDGLSKESGESICAEVRNRNGRRFYFTDAALYIEENGCFLRVSYESIVRCDWIAGTEDFKVKLAQKQEHGDRLILSNSEGVSHELDALGPAFQGMYNFFQWLLARYHPR